MSLENSDLVESLIVGVANETVEEQNVSFALTRILLLTGRIKEGYNARYLPVTIRSMINLIQLLEEKKNRNIKVDDYLANSLQRKSRFCKGFIIPQALLSNPSVEGLYHTISEIAEAQIDYYCGEEKRFIQEQIEPGLKCLLIQCAKQNCELLARYTGKTQQITLGLFHGWCEASCPEPGSPHTGWQ